MEKKFTLIELLVVIAIIAILAGMLLPALGKAKGIAKKAACLGQQKNIAQYMTMYINDYDFMPKSGNINWKPIIQCPVGNHATNQSFFTCALSYYAKDPIKAFVDPASPLPGPTKSCYEVGHYSAPQTGFGFLTFSQVKRPAAKIYASCAGLQINNDYVQGYQLRSGNNQYYPGTMRYIASDAAASKATMLASSPKFMQDFSAGRHGEYTNAIYIDGHLESFTAKGIVNAALNSAQSTYITGGKNSGPFGWTQN